MLNNKIKDKLSEINEILEEDDGGCEFISFEEGVVSIKLKGACEGCEMSEMTVAMVIENEIKSIDDSIKEVVVVE